MAVHARRYGDADTENCRYLVPERLGAHKDGCRESKTKADTRGGHFEKAEGFMPLWR